MLWVAVMHDDAGTVAGCAASAGALKEIFIVPANPPRLGVVPRSKPVHEKSNRHRLL
jgi:hypothetical protein